MDRRVWWAVFLTLLILAVTQANAQVPADAILQDGTDTVTFLAYKPLEGSIEKTPGDQLYLYDTVKSLTRIISSTPTGTVGNAYSDSASITDAGDKAAFHSWATNLVAGTPRCANVFLKDVKTGSVSMIKPQALAPDMTPDGKYIVYEYNADPENTLPAIYRYNTATKEELFIDYTSLGNRKGGWYFPNPQISSDGEVVTYHTTKSGKVEVWQWQNGMTVKVRDGVLTDAPVKTAVQEITK